MSSDMNDPLLERIGPYVVRVLAAISVLALAAPISLLILLPLLG